MYKLNINKYEYKLNIINIINNISIKKQKQRLVSDYPRPSVNCCQWLPSCCVALYKLGSIPDILLDFSTRISFLSQKKKKINVHSFLRKDIFICFHTKFANAKEN